MLFNPSSKYIQKNKDKIKRILLDTDATIFFVASNELKQLIIKNDPNVQEMPDSYKKILLDGNGIRIQKRMLLDWIDNKLNDRNVFVLSKGDIRIVEDPSITIVKKEG